MANPSALHPELAEALGMNAETLAQQKQPDPSPTPAPEPTEANPQAAPGRKYANRYETVEALEAAKLSSDKEAQRMATHERELQEQLNAAQMLLQTLATDRMSPAARSASRPQHEETLAAAGIPLEELDAYINDRARQLVRSEVLDPMTAASQAQRKITSVYPEFPERERDMQKYLNENPEVQRRYDEKLSLNSKHPEEALEWLMQSYIIHSGQAPKRESASGAAEQVQARIDAAVPANGASAAARMSPQQQQAATVQAAWKDYGEGKISKAQMLAIRLGGINPFQKPTG